MHREPSIIFTYIVICLKANISQGHRTYPAFLHFLLSVTLLATYIGIMSVSAVWYAFNNPYTIVSRVPDRTTPILIRNGQNLNIPVHELILAFTGIIFSLVVGSFFFYHVYLVS